MAGLFTRAAALLLLLPLLLTVLPLHRVAPFDGFRAARVRGQRVLIYGASQGLGEEMAYEYARLGARVALVARRAPQLEKVAAEARARGAQEAHVIVGDMADDDSVRASVEQALDAFGGDALDALVLNHAMQYWGWFLGDLPTAPTAGPRLGTTSEHVTFASMDKMVRVNFLSFAKLTTLCVPALARGAASRRGGGGGAAGRVIVVSSGGGKVTVPLQALYSGAKHALHGFFDSLRMELVHKQLPVTVTNVILGATATEKFTTNTAGSVSWPPPCPVDEAAAAIVRAGEVGLEERYYPLEQTLHVMGVLRGLAGVRQLLDRLTLLAVGGRNVFNPF